jgi:hypothetical protein
MTHISSLGAGIFSYLDMTTEAAAGAASIDTAAEYAGLFVGSTPGTADTSDGQVTGVANHVRMPSVREFPSIGTPANIVNVPVYGQKTSSQVQGQADAPTLEVTVNYVANNMTDIHSLIGKVIAFRFMMTEEACTPDEAAGTTLAKNNTQFYFTGKIEAILVNPALTDTTTATVTLSAQTDFIGPATIAAS